ncbi:Hypothetical protein ORPV_935 [Orpheovirus IHUMI-LCC2]|uniref:F-box domain-containing protein n=1 Tax=Orpheovirus IHUMI-LCC2 TaxID=2023057 RepID=A0A2I2L5W3_9VIRU|nr:Hypothetical protein ORPV_935 [Orpheovirus IHUMI-LCC2]SNW62839.1 Hypothetical protein ORPV_935 [Orpheovirus IHUMI-LCC2]
MDYIELYPVEILEHIFQYVPDNILIRFKSCSKYFQQIIVNVIHNKNLSMVSIEDITNFDYIFKGRKNLLLIPYILDYLYRGNDILSDILVSCIKHGFTSVLNILHKDVASNKMVIDELSTNFSMYMSNSIKFGHISLVKFLYEKIYKHISFRGNILLQTFYLLKSIKIRRKSQKKALNYLISNTHMDVFPTKWEIFIQKNLITDEIAITDYCTYIKDISYLWNKREKFTLQYASAFALLRCDLDTFFKYLPYSSYYSFIEGLKRDICIAYNLLEKMKSEHGRKKLDMVFKRLADRFGKTKTLYLLLDIFKMDNNPKQNRLWKILDCLCISESNLKLFIITCKNYTIKSYTFQYYINKFVESVDISFVKSYYKLLGQTNYNYSKLCKKFNNKILSYGIENGYRINVDDEKIYNILNYINRNGHDINIRKVHVDYHKLILRWICYYCPNEDKEKYIEIVSDAISRN